LLLKGAQGSERHTHCVRSTATTHYELDSALFQALGVPASAFETMTTGKITLLQGKVVRGRRVRGCS
jgi:hypothetical protein